MFEDADDWYDNVVDADPPGWREGRRRRHDDDNDGEEYDDEECYGRRRHYRRY